jgi:hypothetical protein
MSRSHSSAISRIISRIIWAACGIALFVMAAPLRAQTLVTTTKFSLTFPTGWTKLPLGTDTAGAAVMNMTNDAFSFLFGAPHAGGALTTEELKAAMLAAGATDSLTKTTEGTKTLGGKSFSFVEFKQAVPDAGDEDARYRVYFYTQGNFLFEAIIGFDTVDSPAAVADLESALATLTIAPGAGLRRLAGQARPLFHRSAHDVLGRTLVPLTVGRVAVPAYTRY